jgi:hypothetical protein
MYVKQAVFVSLILISVHSIGLAHQTAAGDSPTIAGCQIFPPDNIWNTPIDTLPVDEHSDDYIDAIGSDVGLHPDFGSGLWDGGPIGIPYTIVSGDQPAANISFYYPDESDAGPYPIPTDALIEGGPDGDGDRHILLVDSDNCTLYEIFDAYPGDDGSWEAGSGAIWDLSDNALRPDEWTSADAAGLPILPGLVRYDEVEAGAINHALRFTASNLRTAYVWPARHRAECGDHSEDDLSVPPLGQRFRLKAEFDVSTYSSDVQVILIALQTYGLILADCGSDWFISGVPDEGWNNDMLVEELDSITGDNFEAIDVSSLMVDADSAAAIQGEE